jgi:hypothetical protein
MKFMKTLELDETQIRELVAHVGPEGETPHRYIYHLLSQFLTMGYSHRDSWRVILYNGDHEGEVSEAYAKYLDRKACGEDVWFDPAANDGEGAILEEDPFPPISDDEEE